MDWPLKFNLKEKRTTTSTIFNGSLSTTWYDLDNLDYYSFFCFFLFCPKIPQAAIFGNFLFQVFASFLKSVMMTVALTAGNWYWWATKDVDMLSKNYSLNILVCNLSKKCILVWTFCSSILKIWKVNALSENGPYLFKQCFVLYLLWFSKSRLD